MLRHPRYDLGEPLGAGGLGTVFAAYDLLLDRPVSVRVLGPPLAESETLVVRLQDEGRVLAELAHPGIVAPDDIGICAGQLYLVTELCSGVPLRRLLGRWWTVDEAHRCLVAVARAIDTAHRAGLVHGGITADNLTLGADGKVSVLDFGLSVLRAGSDSLGDQHAWGTAAALLLERLPEQTIFDPVIARATDPDPARRFSSLGDAAAALDQAVVAHSAASTVPRALACSSRGRRKGRRTSWFAVIAALGSATTVLGVAAGLAVTAPPADGPAPPFVPPPPVPASTRAAVPASSAPAAPEPMMPSAPPPRPPPPPRLPAKVAARASRCATPYTVDADGVHIPKAECL